MPFENYSKRMAFVGSMRAMSIDGRMSIAVESTNIAMFSGNNHQVNSTGTQSI